MLSGGIVAHNEEASLEGSVRSLLGQELPPGVRWGTIWIVASGCTDRTVEVAERLAARESGLEVLVQPVRRGKAAALDEIFRHAPPGPLILLNSDAYAEPGAVAALLRAAAGRTAPLAVMGRPIVDLGSNTPVRRVVSLLWALHHEFHLATLAEGQGNHLSDELLYLDVPGFAGFPAGVINDGAFLGAWLDAEGGLRLYAPEAGVRIQVPDSFRDHMKQRRRILVGHAQVHELLGRRPTTLARFAVAHPAHALGILARALRTHPARLLDLPRLVGQEIVASCLASWDRMPPRRDHGIWDRIARPAA